MTIWLASTCVEMRDATTFSRRLTRNGRFNIGRSFDRSSVFRFDFFNSGVIKEVLKANGSSPVITIDWLNRCVKNGVRSLQHAFSNHAGIGSSEHCLLGRSRSRLRILLTRRYGELRTFCYR